MGKTDYSPPGAFIVDGAEEGTQLEHNLTFLQACQLYPAAIGWSAFVSLGVIMLAFDLQLLGNLYATPQFQKDFGYLFDGVVSRLRPPCHVSTLGYPSSRCSTSSMRHGRQDYRWEILLGKLLAPFLPVTLWNDMGGDGRLGLA